MEGEGLIQMLFRPGKGSIAAHDLLATIDPDGPVEIISPLPQDQSIGPQTVVQEIILGVPVAQVQRVRIMMEGANWFPGVVLLRFRQMTNGMSITELLQIIEASVIMRVSTSDLSMVVIEAFELETSRAILAIEHEGWRLVTRYHPVDERASSWRTVFDQTSRMETIYPLGGDQSEGWIDLASTDPEFAQSTLRIHGWGPQEIRISETKRRKAVKKAA